MNIEFHLPHGEVRDRDVEYIGNKLIELQQQHKEIISVSVDFNKWKYPNSEKKICKICLVIYGTPFFAQAEAYNYKEASRKALTELAGIIEEWFDEEKLHFEELTSTIMI